MPAGYNFSRPTSRSSLNSNLSSNLSSSNSLNRTDSGLVSDTLQNFTNSSDSEESLGDIIQQTAQINKYFSDFSDSRENHNSGFSSEVEPLRSESIFSRPASRQSVTINIKLAPTNSKSQSGSGSKGKMVNAPPKADPKDTPLVQRILPDQTKFAPATPPMTAKMAASQFYGDKAPQSPVMTGHFSSSKNSSNRQNPPANLRNFTPSQIPETSPTKTLPGTMDSNEILVKFKVGEWTNFHMAAYQDWSPDAIMNLDINLLNVSDPTDGRNPIHIACQYDNYRFLKTILNFYELDLNALDNNGYTALHIAAKHGHERCMNILILTNKVDLNLGGFDSPCPLHLAVANEEIGCVRVLLQAGANVNWVWWKKFN